VNPLDYPLVADENIHPEVVLFLRNQGKEIFSVLERGLRSGSDLALLRLAHSLGRVVLTHDSDYGTLAIAQGEPFTGIIYLRPGHIRPEFTIEMLQTISTQLTDVKTPFILVAERKDKTVRLRLRRL
jgi:predicted nuclease of predicted toxin-antitoxin system